MLFDNIKRDRSLAGGGGGGAILDTFTGANGTLIAGKLTDTGQTWVELLTPTANNDPYITDGYYDNRFNVVTGVLYGIDLGKPATKIQADLWHWGGNRDIGFAFRYVDSLNYWVYHHRVGTQTLRLYRVVAGVAVQVAQHIVGTTYREWNTVTGYDDGSTMTADWNLVPTTISVTDTTHAAGTIVGISATAADRCRVDNFSAE